MARIKFSELRDNVVAQPGAVERLLSRPGRVARERSRTTDVQHDEHQRVPTSAYDGAGTPMPKCQFIRGDAAHNPKVAGSNAAPATL